MSIFENLEILTVTFKSEHIIESCLSQIDTNFKITIVENSDNLDFKKKMEERKEIKILFILMIMLIWVNQVMMLFLPQFILL